MNSPRKTKQVLIFSLAYFPKYVSGAEVAIKEVTNRIDPEAIAFSMITLRYPGTPARERVGNIEVHRVGFGGVYFSKILFLPLAALKARALYRGGEVDALWSVMTYMLFPVVLAKLIGVRAPHMITLQDGDPYEKVFERWFIVPFLHHCLTGAFVMPHGYRRSQSYLAEWPRRDAGTEARLRLYPMVPILTDLNNEYSEAVASPGYASRNREARGRYLSYQYRALRTSKSFRCGDSGASSFAGAHQVADCRQWYARRNVAKAYA
jgi:hypothetical protein